MPVCMFYVYCLCVYVCKQLFKGFFGKFTCCYVTILGKKSQVNIWRKKIVLNWVIFAPILAQKPRLFWSRNPLYEFFWNFVWSHKSEYLKKTLISPKMDHFNPDLAQKLICIVLGIHSNSFLEIFHDHKSLEANKSNSNKYFNKKNSNYPQNWAFYHLTAPPRSQ